MHRFQRPYKPHEMADPSKAPRISPLAGYPASPDRELLKKHEREQMGKPEGALKGGRRHGYG